MKLYELINKNDHSLSPYVWRIKCLLSDKGLDSESVRLGFTDIKEKMSFASKGKVPTLMDGDKVIEDSMAIARYLDEAYPQTKQAFASEVEYQHNVMLDHLTMMQLLFPIFMGCALKLYEGAFEKDKDYFRTSREARMGMTLEQAYDQRDVYFETASNNLKLYLTPLKSADYFAGSEAGYVDYIFYGILQWARGGQAEQVFNIDDEALQDWISRMDARYKHLK